MEATIVQDGGALAEKKVAPLAGNRSANRAVFDNRGGRHPNRVSPFGVQCPITSPYLSPRRRYGWIDVLRLTNLHLPPSKWKEEEKRSSDVDNKQRCGS